MGAPGAHLGQGHEGEFVHLQQALLALPMLQLSFEDAGGRDRGDAHSCGTPSAAHGQPGGVTGQHNPLHANPAHLRLLQTHFSPSSILSHRSVYRSDQFLQAQFITAPSYPSSRFSSQSQFITEPSLLQHSTFCKSNSFQQTVSQHSIFLQNKSLGLSQHIMAKPIYLSTQFFANPVYLSTWFTAIPVHCSTQFVPAPKLLQPSLPRHPISLQTQFIAELNLL